MKQSVMVLLVLFFVIGCTNSPGIKDGGKMEQMVLSLTDVMQSDRISGGWREGRKYYDAAHVLDESLQAAPEYIGLWEDLSRLIVLGDGLLRYSGKKLFEINDVLLELDDNNLYGLYADTFWKHWRANREDYGSASLYEGDVHEAYQKLCDAYPQEAQTLEQIILKIESVLANPVADCTADAFLAGLGGGKPGILVLGYQLNEDGSMQQALYERLHKAEQVLDVLPDSRVIVTGGSEKNGVREADQMSSELIAKGVAPEQIILETQAGSTVENMVFSYPILAEQDVDAVLLVTSATHMRRSQIILEAVALRNDSRMTVYPAVSWDTTTGDFTEEESLALIYSNAFQGLGLCELGFLNQSKAQ